MYSTATTNVFHAKQANSVRDVALLILLDVLLATLTFTLPSIIPAARALPCANYAISLNVPNMLLEFQL